MPINFQPAAPFAPKISEQAGRVDQFNKIFPTLAGLYEAAGRNYTSASAQTAQNQTQASAVSAGLESRRQMQERDIEAQREQMNFQAQLRLEEQQRQQQFEMMRMQLPITRQEEMQNQARMNGLVEIERMLKEKTMTPEQAADARFELATGINAFQRRQQFQNAQRLQQQAQLETQQYDLANKNQMTAEAAQSEMAKRGVYSWYETDPRTGETHFNVFNPKTGEIYNPRSSGGRGEQKMDKVSPYADEAGGFSYKKAYPEAEAEAKTAYPVIMDQSEDGKRQIDTNAKDRAKYLQQLMEKKADQHRAGMSNQANRGAPVTAPQQDSPKSQAESQLLALRQQYPDPSKAPPAVQQQMRALYQQYKSQ